MKQSIVLGDPCTTRMQSTKADLLHGSSVGPILLTLFPSPLGDICRKYNVSFHYYTDDLQHYLSFHLSVEGAMEECLERLQQCISEIQAWLRINFLKLNEGKTEFLVTGTR